MTDDNLRLHQPGKPNFGTSDAAARRLKKRIPAVLHVAGHVGELIEMEDCGKSGKRAYRVAADGSFRRVPALQKAA